MTTHIPYLTLPSAIFEHQAAAILLPVALGTAVGYSSRRTLCDPQQHEPCLLIMPLLATEVQKTYSAIKQPPLHPPPWVFGPVWTLLYG